MILSKNYWNLIVFFFPFLTFSQSPNIAWQKRMGSYDTEIAGSMCLTSDGGFFVGGRSKSNALYEKTQNSRGGADYWVLKLDSNGIIQWDKTIGGAQTNGNTHEHDVFRDLKQTPDGGFVICGNSDSPISGDKTESCRGYFDYWIVKLDSTGSIEWQRTIGGDFPDESGAIINTIDGGFIIGGSSWSNISGEKTENSRGNNDIWLVKLSATGIIEWQKTIGGADSDSIGINCIIQNSNGDYILAANSRSNISGEKADNSRGNSDLWLLKLNSIGEILNQRTIGGSDYEYPVGIIPTTDGNYLISVISKSPISGEKTDYCRGGQDGWFLKVDNSFTIIWQKTIGGDKDENFDKPYQCNDNGFIVSCSSQSGISGEKNSVLLGYTDAWVLKLNEIGNIEWQKTIGGAAPGIYSGQDGFLNQAQLTDGSFVLFGTTDSEISGDIVDFPRGDSDYWLVKLEPESLSTTDFVGTNALVYPNPTTKTLYIKLPKAYQCLTVGVVNILGQTVMKKTINNSSEIKLDLEVSKGIYLVNVLNENNENVTFKVVKN